MSAGTLNGKSLALQALTVNGVSITGNPASGVSTLNGLSNAVTLTSTGDTLTIVPSGQNINFTVKPVDVNTIVQSLTTTTTGASVLQGAVTFASSDASITLDAIGAGNGTMDFKANFPAAVTSLNTIIGPITLESSDDSINFNTGPSGQSIDLSVNFPTPPPQVTLLNNISGAVTLTSPDSSITITPNSQDIELVANIIFPESVTSLNGEAGPLTLTSPDASITITPDGTDIQLQVVFPPPPATVTSLNGVVGPINLTSPDNSITITPAGGDIQLQAVAPPAAPVRQATYYKSVQQNLINANTDITFDLTGAWSNAGGYITHTAGTADFTVVVSGLYQLEFNLSVNANGATWNNSLNKAVSIDITRASLGEQAVIQNNALTAVSTSYQQAVVSSFYLEAGDVINLRSTLPFATATPFAVGVQNTFDLNTFFAWTYVSSAGSPTPTILSGIYTEATGGSTTATITATGITASSVVVATYIHPANGGANHYIKAITPTTNTITVLSSAVITVGDKINWIAYV